MNGVHLRHRPPAQPRKRAPIPDPNSWPGSTGRTSDRQTPENKPRSNTPACQIGLWGGLTLDTAPRSRIPDRNDPAATEHGLACQSVEWSLGLVWARTNSPISWTASRASGRNEDMIGHMWYMLVGDVQCDGNPCAAGEIVQAR